MIDSLMEAICNFDEESGKEIQELVDAIQPLDGVQVVKVVENV